MITGQPDRALQNFLRVLTIRRPTPNPLAREITSPSRAAVDPARREEHIGYARDTNSGREIARV